MSKTFWKMSASDIQKKLSDIAYKCHHECHVKSAVDIVKKSQQIHVPLRSTLICYKYNEQKMEQVMICKTIARSY